MVDVALIGQVAVATFPVGVVLWSYLLYKLILKSVKYNIDKFIQGLKREVLA